MKLKPVRGTIFVTAVDTISSVRTIAGFGGKTEKYKVEVPYKFRVEAVGDMVPSHGLWVESEVEVGDIVSSQTTNTRYRENWDEAGFVIDGIRYLILGFEDILGVWEE